MGLSLVISIILTNKQSGQDRASPTRPRGSAFPLVYSAENKTVNVSSRRVLWHGTHAPLVQRGTSRTCTAWDTRTRFTGIARHKRCFNMFNPPRWYDVQRAAYENFS